MSLSIFMSSIADEFSGKVFTEKNLIDFICTGKAFDEDSNHCIKKGKVKKEPHVKKMIRMTFRSYMMTEETDVFKAKITTRVAMNKEWNEDHKELIMVGDEEKLSENFFAVLKVVMTELTEEEKEHIEEKVTEYNDKHFGVSDDESK